MSGRERAGFAFGIGACAGTADGLIGLGGAEFRLPALVGPLRFSPREAVAVNLVASFIVLAAALPFRAVAAPGTAIAPHVPALLGMLAGAMSSAWIGAGWLRHAPDRLLAGLILALLLGLGCVLIAEGLFAPEPMRLVGTGLVPTVFVAVLKIGLGIILIWSAWSVFRHLPERAAARASSAPSRGPGDFEIRFGSIGETSGAGRAGEETRRVEIPDRSLTATGTRAGPSLVRPLARSGPRRSARGRCERPAERDDRR